MFAGHIGAAMAIGRAERRVNLGVLVFAALLLDFVLWLLVLLGFESVVIPGNFASTHQPAFEFPWSHSLLAAIVWSLLAGIAALLGFAKLGPARVRVALLVGLAVFSHWLLDALVHAPELPIAGAASAKVGMHLWGNMPVALAIEALIAMVGLWLYVSGASLSRGRRLLLAVLAIVTLVFTIIGMTVAPPPPSVAAMAYSSLVTIAIVSALAGWLAW
jgi:hypothetical protein